MPQLFAGMRDPPHRARHGKQHQFMAGRQAERVHQHRKGIVDIDELAGCFGDALGDFVGEFTVRAGARQRFQQGPRAGIAMLVDPMTKAREAFAERDALADTGATSPLASVFKSCAASTPAPPCFGPFSATRPAMIES